MFVDNLTNIHAPYERVRRLHFRHLCGVTTALAVTFAGAPELYAVPRHSDVRSVTLKLWGAGGGGVLTPALANTLGETGTSNATQGTPTVKMIEEPRNVWKTFPASLCYL